MNPLLASAWQHAIDTLPLVAILRGIAPQESDAVGASLWNAGWRLLEVPLNSPDPLRSISALARRYPDAIVGAGTVRTPEEVRQVHAAGGRLVVSPHFDARVVQAASTLGMVVLPGVMTPSEAFAALDAGASGLKLFPAEMIPPAAVKALRAVLPAQALLLPVGGISPASMAGYRAAGANGFGIGSALFTPGMDAQAVAAAARAFADAWAGTMRA
ncbi:MAG TPA: 2-dehydro-3-deoxy-6-phosphogalactonate aldolase [Ramlibacter sp.]|nr:2-dehydro-3-deoxy-6-phosphogalactonate aldolase [Ramlibacter sp.]